MYRKSHHRTSTSPMAKRRGLDGADHAKACQTRSGFTLVELMVALGATIFMLALFTLLMTSATESMSTSQGISAADETVRNALLTIRDDLEKVYIANKGARLSPSRLFTGPDQIPTQGYFMVEENDRALRQGMDTAGVPVEVDTDDVLAMTVGNPSADSPEDFYFGYVYDDPTITNTAALINDIGEYLDSQFDEPLSRFDNPGNQQFTSRFAEVVYFLRPTTTQVFDRQTNTWVIRGRQYAVPELQGNLAIPSYMPALPSTYTLHRRQLVVAQSASALNKALPGYPAGFPLTALPANRSPYDVMDVSISRRWEVNTTAPAPYPVQWTFEDTAGSGFLPRLHFNTLEDLSKREYRYGMRLMGFNNPVAGASPATLLRALPLSHRRQISTDYYGLLHDYFRLSPTDAYDPANPPIVPWFGRPTQFESNHPDFPFWPAVTGPPFVVNADAFPPPLTTLDIADANNDAAIDAYSQNRGQRSGDDVLLTNVISFDVKILEDLAFPSTVPGAPIVPEIRLLGARAVNAMSDIDMTAAPWNEATAPVPLSLTDIPYVVRPEFVDLGFGYDNLAAAHQLYRPAGSAPPPPPQFYPGNDAINVTQRYTNYVYSPTASTFGLPFNPTNPTYVAPPGTPPNYRMEDDPIAGRDGIIGTADDITEANAVETVTTLRTATSGFDGAAGRAGDDNGDGVPDDSLEYMLKGSDDISRNFWVPFRLPGRVGSTKTGAGGTLDNNAALNPGWINPRNTYDSWSADYDPDPGTTTPPAPNPNFRGVPYPRPIKGIQIKLRVLEPKSGLVREFTLRHYFK